MCAHVVTLIVYVFIYTLTFPVTVVGTCLFSVWLGADDRTVFRSPDSARSFDHTGTEGCAPSPRSIIYARQAAQSLPLPHWGDKCTFLLRYISQIGPFKCRFY